MPVVFSVFGKCPYCFLQCLDAFQPNVYKSSSFSTSTPEFLTFVFFIIAILSEGDDSTVCF